jgi:hypothetical protein
MMGEAGIDDRGRQTFFKSYFLLPLKLDGDPGLPHGGWQQKQTTVEQLLGDERLLAEYLYFHPHVRGFLYDYNQSDEGLHYYELGNQEGSLAIRKRPGDDGLPDSLLEARIPTAGVSCYRFYNDVCILVIETQGRMPAADVLDFNNLSRRLFSGFGDPRLQQRHGEFPTRLQVSLPIAGHEALEITTDFATPDSSAMPGAPAGVVLKPEEVFARRIFHPAVRQLLGRLFPGAVITPLLDDRMLLLCRIAIEGDPPATDEERRVHDIVRSRGMWVDKGGLKSKEYDEAFLDELERGLSNNRWRNAGGEMGFSRYSAFFMGYDSGLTGNGNGRVEGGKLAYLFDHLDTMYLKMFLMAAFYRGTLLKLSGQVAELISGEAKAGSGTRKQRLALARRIKNTLREVVLFSNRYWFTELTNQDQGIEIFDLMRKAFRLDEMFEALKSDVQRTDTYLDSLLAIEELERGEEEREFDRKLGWWGVWFGALAVTTGFLGMNIFEAGRLGAIRMWPFQFSLSWLLFCVIILVAVGCAAWLLIRRPWKRSDGRRDMQENESTEGA